MEKVLDTLIIGSGFSGLCMAIKLKEAGIHNIALIEKAAALGGTWRDNSYPGAACDVPSRLYSFSFAPNFHWSRRYPGQAEILSYMQRVASDYGIIPHIQFNSEVCQARYDEQSKLWQVSVRNVINGAETQLSTKILVTGTGQLNRPKILQLPGQDEFQGHIFHSATWDHSVDLDNKRIAVLGNGASAIQFIPEIAPKAKRLTIFQRSASWIGPKKNPRINPRFQALQQKWPWLDKFIRLYIYLSLDLHFHLMHPNSWMAKISKHVLTKRIRDEIDDPQLQEKLIPDYQVGCKRILISDDYFQTMNRDNVEVNTHGIGKLTRTAVIDNSGAEIPVDVLIFATGFLASELLAPIEITGLNSESLQQHWRAGAEAYRGVAVSGFPNLFLLYGPNTNLGHNSIIFMIENQVAYIMRCIKHFRLTGGTCVTVRNDAQQRYNEKIQREISETVWAGDCNSWYKNSAGKVVNNWSKTSYAYKKLMADFDPTVFQSLG